ncbi:MAG: hypothetical protein L0G99_05585, partial [Propionibacteriales bacterium]|nr:hypothetical protein [Propionibacteriales bacterium]
MDLMRRGDDGLALLGLPTMFLPTIEQCDFDVDSLIGALDVVSRAASRIGESGPPADGPLTDGDAWSGPAHRVAVDYFGCVSAWWQEVLDFLLGIVDWLVQVIDWLLDLLGLVCQILTWLATWVTAIAFVAILGAAFIPPLAVIGDVAAKVFAVSGVVAVASLVLGLLIQVLDWLIDRLQDLIRA